MNTKWFLLWFFCPHSTKKKSLRFIILCVFNFLCLFSSAGVRRFKGEGETALAMKIAFGSKFSTSRTRATALRSLIHLSPERAQGPQLSQATTKVFLQQLSALPPGDLNHIGVPFHATSSLTCWLFLLWLQNQGQANYGHGPNWPAACCCACERMTGFYICKWVEKNKDNISWHLKIIQNPNFTAHKWNVFGIQLLSRYKGGAK